MDHAQKKKLLMTVLLGVLIWLCPHPSEISDVA